MDVTNKTASDPPVDQIGENGKVLFFSQRWLTPTSTGDSPANPDDGQWAGARGAEPSFAHAALPPATRMLPSQPQAPRVQPTPRPELSASLTKFKQVITASRAWAAQNSVQESDVYIWIGEWWF